MKKIFEINSELYSEEKINEAIESFSEIWDIIFLDWKIIISWDNMEEINEIFNELMNYIIWLINE